MQKVEGSSPFSRSSRKPATAGFCVLGPPPPFSSRPPLEAGWKRMYCSACRIGRIEILGRRGQPVPMHFDPLDLDLVPGEKLFGEPTSDWRRIAMPLSEYA